MTYPRLLNLDEDTRQRLISYMNDELTRHHAERQQAIDDLIQWQSDYWAKPSSERRTFPFTGAANIIIPLTAIAYETIHARSITTHFGVTPFTSVKARLADFQRFETPLENFMQFELLYEVKARQSIDDILAELEKFGTGIGKSGYERIVRKAVRPNAVGGEEEIAVIVKDGPTLDPVPNANFIMPFYAKDPQTAPWSGEIHSDNPFRIKLLEEGGLFYPGTREKLEAWVIEGFNAEGQNQERKYERHIETLEKRVAHWPKLVIWDELWMSFDVDGDNHDEEIVVHYHEPSQLVLAARYNWHSDLHRPYRIGQYIRVENRWRGLGICKQNEQFQRSITTRHRQSLDSGTIQNMQMFKVHNLSGYGPKEPIFPGKMWFLDDMSHIESFSMGSTPLSNNLALEQSDLLYSQMRSKVNEVTLGMPQQGTPGTATGDLARIREGQMGFDYVFQNEKLLISDLVMDVLANVHQFGTRHTDYFQHSEGGELLRQLFTLPMPLIRDSILFDIGAAGQQQNRVLDRQNWVQISQIVQMYYVNMIQLAQMSGDPQIMSLVVTKGFTAATEAMRQILESFDIRNIDRMILTELEQMLQQGGNPNATNDRFNALLNAGGAPGSARPGQAPGLDILAEIGKRLGGNGAPRLAGV